MITIYKTNSMADAARYINSRLAKTDKSNLAVSHTVIVPDRASLEAERALLQAVGGSFNIQVKTFRRLAADLLPKYDYLSKQAGIMALNCIIKDNRDNLTCFVKGVDTPGFVESAYETISMMKYCKITPQMLYNAQLPQGVTGKVHDIALLYQAYCDFTEGRFVDSADKMELLCDCLANTDAARDNCYYLYDFDNFSAQELAVVEQLMLHASAVTVACCAGADIRDKNLYLDDIYNGVSALCRRNGIIPQIVCGEHYADRYAEHIGRNLYRYGKKSAIAANGRVEIFEGTTRHNEVYALACKIQRYVRQGGRYKDIYVVASDVAKYTNAVSAVFDRFDIPYFCDRQFALSDHPYARFVVDYLTLCKYNGKLNYVLPFVKNYLFCGNFDGDLRQNDDVFLFENYCLKYNVSYKYNAFTLGTDMPYFGQADKFRARFNALYSAVQAPASATVAQYVNIVRQLVTVADLNTRNAVFADMQSAQGLEFEAKVTRQVAEKFEKVLLQAEQVLGNRYVQLDEFIKMLLTGISAVKISVLPVYSDCVIFANMAKARKHDIKFLALLGANYGAMPIVKSDCKLLSDRNIKDMVSAGINVEPQILTENRREKFSLFQLLLEPATKLYVSYATADGSDSLLPSPFVAELRQLFSDKGVTPLPLCECDDDVYTSKQAIERVVYNTRRLRDHQPVNMAAYRLLSARYADEIGRFAFDKDGKKLRVCRGGELYLKNSSTSVSQLTDFYKCPYRFYLQYGLNVKPRPIAQLQAADLGNILHAVLERYVRDIVPDEPDATTVIKADKYFEEALDGDFYRGLRNDVKMAGILDQLRAESKRMCNVVKHQLYKSEFVNLATELEFGENAPLPPVVVTFGGGSFSLVGKIDRVDVKDGRFIVIDYKSGASAAAYSEKDLYIGHKMQLPVYVRAVQQHYGTLPAGFYYFNMHDNFTDVNKDSVYFYNGRTLNDPDVACALDTDLRYGKSVKLGLKLNNDGTLNRTGNKLLSDEQFANQTEYAFRLIARAGDLMNDGYAAVRPYDGACKYCDYKDVCDFDDVFTYEPRQVKGKITSQTIDKTVDK